MSKIFSLSDNHGDQRMDPYPYSSLWINGRQALLENIVHGREVARSSFEESTFEFIRDWITNRTSFDMSTSGSTGTPKTISVSRTQMVMSAKKTVRHIGLRAGCAALVCIDTKYIGGKMMLARSLTLGLPIMALEPCANPLIRIPIDKCVQFTAFVPYQVHQILESKHPHLLNNPDKVLVGGAPVHDSDAARLDAFQCEFYETYGMTETVSHVALRLINTERKQPYFSVLQGIEIAQDHRGCLVITADYLPETVVTNDIVEIIDSSRFRWLGRWDRVINSGGVKVHPEKIEKQLDLIFRELGLRHRFFIAALPDEKFGSKVVLIMEGVQISSELLTQSLQALRHSLSPYEIPREVFTIPEFQMTATQKLDQQKTLAGVSAMHLPKFPAT